MKVKRESVRGKEHVSSSDPPSSSPPLSSPTLFSSSPGSPPDSDGWQKSTKVARRHSPEAGSSDRSEGGGVPKGGGGIFGPLVDCMELDCRRGS